MHVDANGRLTEFVYFTHIYRPRHLVRLYERLYSTATPWLMKMELTPTQYRSPCCLAKEKRAMHCHQRHRRLHWVWWTTFGACGLILFLPLSDMVLETSHNSSIEQHVHRVLRKHFLEQRPITWKPVKVELIVNTTLTDDFFGKLLVLSSTCLRLHYDLTTFSLLFSYLSVFSI